MSKRVTIILLAIAAVVLIGWDIFAAFFDPTPGDTISEILLTWSHRVKTLPLAFGVLGGHLFWPWNYPKNWKRWTVPVLGLIAVASIVVDVLCPLPSFPTVVPVLIGVVLGHTLWPQKPVEL